jgi:hypothetical protein
MNAASHVFSLGRHLSAGDRYELISKRSDQSRRFLGVSAVVEQRRRRRRAGGDDNEDMANVAQQL